MTSLDYYTVLNLTPNCTLKEVKHSYRKLALKWHPDKCHDKHEAQNRFNEIHEAYSVLGDDRKKKIYDTYGHDGLKIDHDGNDPSNPRKGNMFFQKGFRGTEKSAFDILKDIMDENEDDSFFSNFEDFGFSNSFKSTFQGFLDDNIFSNDNDTNTGFFDTYKPTFMNPNFFMEPPGFGDLGFEENCTTHIFSFLSTNSGEQTYSRTSSTVFQSGKVTTSTKDRFQDGTNIYEKAKAQQYTNNKCSNKIYGN